LGPQIKNPKSVLSFGIGIISSAFNESNNDDFSCISPALNAFFPLNITSKSGVIRKSTGNPVLSFSFVYASSYFISRLFIKKTNDLK
jgi:hypothetical protein